MPKPIDTLTIPAVTFRDKAFKSRTIVLPDGRTFTVEKSRITSDDEALTAHLDKHPEFERLNTLDGV